MNNYLDFNTSEDELEVIKDLILIKRVGIDWFDFGAFLSFVFQLLSFSFDGDQIMAGLHMNNHDQGSKFWTSSQFEEPGPSHIYN
jgi:hypothetical protein